MPAIPCRPVSLTPNPLVGWSGAATGCWVLGRRGASLGAERRHPEGPSTHREPDVPDVVATPPGDLKMTHLVGSGSEGSRSDCNSDTQKGARAVCGGARALRCCMAVLRWRNSPDGSQWRFELVSFFFIASRAGNALAGQHRTPKCCIVVRCGAGVCSRLRPGYLGTAGHGARLKFSTSTGRVVLQSII